MHEVANTYMRAQTGWVEVSSPNANTVYQFKDAVMTIFPNGSWRCVGPKSRLTTGVAVGNVNNLELFLQAWANANPL
jgi:hypothetical protein